MDLALEGRSAFVSGATRGLGWAVARALASEGARVVLTGRDAAGASRRAEELGGGAVGLGLDLTDPTSVLEAAATANSCVGHLDILVLNGGGPPRCGAANLDAVTLAAGSELLLEPMIELVGAFLAPMRRKGFGRIVAITSSGVAQPIAGLAISNMYRSALTTYLKTLAGEVASDGVTVNTVVPGRFATDRTRGLDDAKAQAEGVNLATIRERSIATIPMARFGDPDELAAAATFLCSSRASYITGQQLRVDGGLIAGV